VEPGGASSPSFTGAASGNEVPPSTGSATVASVAGGATGTVLSTAGRAVSVEGTTAAGSGGGEGSGSDDAGCAPSRYWAGRPS
jgi:hypothetical protein